MHTIHRSLISPGATFSGQQLWCVRTDGSCLALAVRELIWRLHHSSALPLLCRKAGDCWHPPSHPAAGQAHSDRRQRRAAHWKCILSLSGQPDHLLVWKVHVSKWISSRWYGHINFNPAAFSGCSGKVFIWWHTFILCCYSAVYVKSASCTNYSSLQMFNLTLSGCWAGWWISTGCQQGHFSELAVLAYSHRLNQTLSSTILNKPEHAIVKIHLINKWKTVHRNTQMVSTEKDVCVCNLV